MPLRVVFGTSVFDGASNGPAVYARYLWESFRDDPDLDFHVVSTAIEERHPRLHIVQSPSRGTYSTYDEIGKNMVRLAAETKGRVVLHGNNTHTMFALLRYRGPWIAQVNDYESAEAYRRLLPTLWSHGTKKFLVRIWRRIQEGRVLHACTRAICNSVATLHHVRANYRGLDRSKFVVINKAVQVTQFQRPSEMRPDPMPERPKGARIVFVGTDWRRKGLTDLIRAMAHILGEFPNLHLVVVGPTNRRSLAKLHRIIAKAGLTDHILLAKRVPHDILPALFSHSDVFCLPSREEALGVAILEAMTAGLPVVSCATGGIPEIIRSSDEGILVPPRRPLILAGALAMVLRDPSVRQRLCENGPRRAQDFNVKRMASAIKGLYIQLARDCPDPFSDCSP